MFSGNVYIRGLDELGKQAAEEMLREASQLANLADAKKVSLGVPNFREQFVLSNGATLDVVINEHHSFMNIVGAGEEFEEEVEEEEIEGEELLTTETAEPELIKKGKDEEEEQAE